MPESVAQVRTDRPGRYLTQLCRHFARKVHAEWGDTHGVTDFGWGTCTMHAGDGVLTLSAQAPDAAGLARVEQVVRDHAERFGARDGLTVAWHPAHQIDLGIRDPL